MHVGNRLEPVAARVLDERVVDRARGRISIGRSRRMPEPDRAIAERLHAIMKTIAPELLPRTWYGMPAYAKDGDVVCFFQAAQKFKTRYATLGFSDKARLDDGDMWPTAFAVRKLNAADEAKIRALLEKARR